MEKERGVISDPGRVEQNLCNGEIFIFPILKTNNNVLKFFSTCKKALFLLQFWQTLLKSINIMMQFQNVGMESIFFAKSQCSYISWFYPDWNLNIVPC